LTHPQAANSSDSELADSPTTEVDSPAGPPSAPADDEGPGCLPGIMAATALAMMLFFIFCGISTWYLFQQRTELAIRTLTGDVIPALQQSNLPPEEKAEVVQILEGVVSEAQAGQLEDWQASGIMERLNRSPILEWGDLSAVEAMIAASDAFTDEEQAEAEKQLSRLRKAVDQGEATAVDFSRDVLDPVLIDEDPSQRPRLDRQATAAQLRKVVEEAKVVADRARIADASFDVKLSDIIRREVEAGKTVGGF